MFESDCVTEDEDEDKDNGKEGSKEDSKAKEAGEKEDDSENGTNDEEDQDEDMKAVIISVKKGDEDKCKDELIDAGISEDDIEILDADEDAENIEMEFLLCHICHYKKMKYKNLSPNQIN